MKRFLATGLIALVATIGFSPAWAKLPNDRIKTARANPNAICNFSVLYMAAFLP